MRWVFLIGGALLAVCGTVWTLQGLGVLGGSTMSGVTMWALIGPVVAILGVALILAGTKRPR